MQLKIFVINNLHENPNISLMGWKLKWNEGQKPEYFQLRIDTTVT